MNIEERKWWKTMFREYGLVPKPKGVCKGGCRHCLANKMTAGKGHPNWEIMFWQSISSNGKYERSHRWQDRGKNNIEDVTQFEMGMNNRKYRGVKRQRHIYMQSKK
jgi:hypothetical protein